MPGVWQTTEESSRLPGKKYCDCPACAAVEAILEKKEEMLA